MKNAGGRNLGSNGGDGTSSGVGKKFGDGASIKGKVWNGTDETRFTPFRIFIVGQKCHLDKFIGGLPDSPFSKPD